MSKFMLKKIINRSYFIVVIFFLMDSTYAQNEVLVDTSLIMGDWIMVDGLSLGYHKMEEDTTQHYFSFRGTPFTVRTPDYREYKSESLIIGKKNKAKIIYPPAFWREAIPSKFKKGKNPYENYISSYQYSLKKETNGMYFFKLDTINKEYYIDKYGYDDLLMVVNPKYLIIGNIIEDSTSLKITDVTIYVRGKENIEKYLDDQMEAFCLIKEWFKQHNISLKAKSIKCFSD